jgi:hypothetical protein
LVPYPADKGQERFTIRKRVETDRLSQMVGPFSKSMLKLSLQVGDSPTNAWVDIHSVFHQPARVQTCAMVSASEGLTNNLEGLVR